MRLRPTSLRPGVERLLVDWGIVLVLAAVTEWHVFVADDVAGPRWLTASLPILIDLPLAWRRRSPIHVTAFVMAGVALQALVSGNAAEGAELFFPALVALYSAGAYRPWRRALVALAIYAAGTAIHDVEDPFIRTHGYLTAAFYNTVGIVMFVVGAYVRSRRETRVAAERADALEAEARDVAASERARIARELHDIVAHSLGVISVQSGGALALADTRPDLLRGPLEKIERASRDALVEMRRLLGVLREDGASSLREPQPGIADLSRLAETMRSAGLPVALHVDDDQLDLPAGVDLSAYRIVHEALTNVLKHAGPASAEVHVHRYGTQLAIDVVDDGRGNGNGQGTGHGLIGIRERVALYGGTVEAGGRREGGFAVRARLPVRGGDAV